MSNRAELYRVVRGLKSYLRWQKASGAPGSVPAPAAEREAFEAKKKAREQAKLEQMKRDIGAASAPKTSAPKTSAPETNRGSAEAAQASPSQESPSQESPSQKQETSKKPAFQIPSKNPSPSKEQGAPEQPERDSAESAPWKTIGSRPSNRFGSGQRTPEAKQKSKPDQTSKSSKGRRKTQNQAPKKQAPKKQAQQKQAKPAMSNDGPDYDESFYPEADDMAPPADYDPRNLQTSKPSQNQQTPAQKKPKKADKTSAEMTKQEKLDFLVDYMGDCKRCGLCEGRTNIVFGVGNPEAKLVFVGEAPGYNEDKQGEPFVGKAGQLLDKMIEAMGLKREDVYICNVIKCRPPDNRNPLSDEIKECSPFLRKQLEVIDPDVIVTLGKFASQFITGQDNSMGGMRGKWHDWQGTPVMATYHPAYLLRSPQQKGKAWSDLQMVMEKLGI